MQGLVTISLRTGIAMPDGGYSPVLVGYMGEKINPGAPVSLSDGASFAAQQSGFMLHANEAGSSIKVLVYDDAVSGICACIVPPAEACDLRYFNIEAAMHNLRALELYQHELAKPPEEQDLEHDSQQDEGGEDNQQIDDANQIEDTGNQEEQGLDSDRAQTEQGAE